MICQLLCSGIAAVSAQSYNDVLTALMVIRLPIHHIDTNSFKSPGYGARPW